MSFFVKGENVSVFCLVTSFATVLKYLLMFYNDLYLKGCV